MILSCLCLCLCFLVCLCCTYVMHENIKSNVSRSVEILVGCALN